MFLHLLFILILSSLSSLQISAQVTVTTTPKTLTKTNNKIQITWSNLPTPSNLDWLGIYSPPNSTHQNFIGYFFLSSSPSWQSGSGSLTFPLINLRSDYEFRIFRWSEKEINPKKHDHDNNPLPGTKRMVARSGIVGFEKMGGPEQVHLAFTDKSDEMRVMFVTKDGGESFVRYGLKEDSLDFAAGTSVGRYERDDMCDAPANESVGWRDPGFVHDGVMVNLMKGRRYYYKVGSDSKGWSMVYSFVSRDEDSDETLGFLFGDMGTAAPYATFRRTQDESITTMKWILRDIEALGDKPAFISHIGDISYARGYSWIWDNFFDQIEPVASKVPYHVCIGNHEYDWPLQPWKPDWSSSIYGKDGGGECGVPYSLRFHMPGNYSEPTGVRAPATRNLFYSFDKGAVHFVYMSTETNFLRGSPQYEFLSQDLESVNRTKTPFVVVQGHRPMYTTSYESRDALMREKLIDHLEPLFVKNKVTLAFWGHVHRYERFCPMKNSTCRDTEVDTALADGSVVHVVIGMAGMDWQPIWEPRKDHLDVPIFPQPKHSLYRGGEFGYTRLAANKEKLTLSYVGNHDGEVHDMVEILASGQVLSGGTKAGASIRDNKNDKGPGMVVESTFSWYVKGAIFVVVGVFIGYALGFISHAKKEADSRKWIPVKLEDL